MRGRPEDQHAQLFFDVVKSVLHLCRDEHQAAGPHRALLVRHPDASAAADHVVHLVLEVGLLAVDRSGRPDRQPDAQPVRPQEVDVAMTLAVARLRVEVRDLMGLRGQPSLTGSSRRYVPAAKKTDATLPSDSRRNTARSPD